MNREQLVKRVLVLRNELKAALMAHDSALVEFYEEMLELVKAQLKQVH